MGSANISFELAFNESDFLHQALQALPYSVLLFDKNITAVYANDAAEEFSEDLAADQNKPGDFVCCSFNQYSDEGCGKTSYCKYCPLRSNIAEVFRTKENIALQTIEMVCHVSDIPQVKVFEFSAKLLEVDKEPLVLVLLNEVTEQEVQEQEMIFNLLNKTDESETDLSK